MIIHRETSEEEIWVSSYNKSLVIEISASEMAAQIAIPSKDCMQWAWDVFCLACEANGVDPKDAIPQRSADSGDMMGFKGKIYLHVGIERRWIGQVFEITTDPSNSPEDCK